MKKSQVLEVSAAHAIRIIAEELERVVTLAGKTTVSFVFARGRQHNQMELEIEIGTTTRLRVPISPTPQLARIVSNSGNELADEVVQYWEQAKR